MKVIDDMVKYLSKEKALPLDLAETLYEQGLIQSKAPLKSCLVSLIEEASRGEELVPEAITQAVKLCVKYSFEGYLEMYCDGIKAEINYALKCSCEPRAEELEKLLAAARFTVSELNRIWKETTPKEEKDQEEDIPF